MQTAPIEAPAAVAKAVALKKMSVLKAPIEAPASVAKLSYKRTSMKKS